MRDDKRNDALKSPLIPANPIRISPPFGAVAAAADFGFYAHLACAIDCGRGIRIVIGRAVIGLEAEIAAREAADKVSAAYDFIESLKAEVAAARS